MYLYSTVLALNNAAMKKESKEGGEGGTNKAKNGLQL